MLLLCFFLLPLNEWENVNFNNHEVSSTTLYYCSAFIAFFIDSYTSEIKHNEFQHTFKIPIIAL